MKVFDFAKKLTDDDIKKIEKYFNIELPEEYKDHILLLNGKSYSGAYIKHPQYDELDFSRFISLNKKDKRSIYDIYQKSVEEMKYFPFADNDFGDYYCFDLENKEIVLWFHETQKNISICESFAEFLEMMKN